MLKCIGFVGTPCIYTDSTGDCLLVFTVLRKKKGERVAGTDGTEEETGDGSILIPVRLHWCGGAHIGTQWGAAGRSGAQWRAVGRMTTRDTHSLLSLSPPNHLSLPPSPILSAPAPVRVPRHLPAHEYESVETAPFFLRCLGLNTSEQAHLKYQSKRVVSVYSVALPW